LRRGVLRVNLELDRRTLRWRGSIRYLAAMHRIPVTMSRAAFDVRISPVCAGDQGDGIGVNDGEGQVGVATKTRTRSKKPSQYKVLMLNDDYTPMEFVVLVLKRFFRMDIEQATRVMLHVHQRGVGVCGIFPYEVAETKVNQVMDFARENQHPLQCTLEKA
jgi:ATP-dependent Clp protease adaptor protein ClpS